MNRTKTNIANKNCCPKTRDFLFIQRLCLILMIFALVLFTSGCSRGSASGDPVDNTPSNTIEDDSNQNSVDESEDNDTSDDIPDNDDKDSDNDGVDDDQDAFPENATETIDTDGDGIGNNSDTDDDNDGVTDSADSLPLDPSNIPTVLETYDLSQETYTYERICTIRAQQGVPGEELLTLGTTITAYGDYYFVFMMEVGSARPKILKINQHDTSIVESGYLEGPDYAPRADGHHHFTMEVDRDGYLHVVGDMHNYGQDGVIKSNEDHLPVRLQGQPILYWRTNSPQNVGSFEFYGNNGNLAPQGRGFTYPKLFSDREGALYITTRNSIGKGNDGTLSLNGRGAGLTRYDPTTETWSIYGDYPKAEDNPYARGSVLAYETEPMAFSHFYSKMISSVVFDNANRMHFATVLNKNDTDNFDDIAQSNGLNKIFATGTDLIYLRSDDLTNFVKPDNTPVELPAGVDPGADQGEVVFICNDPNGEVILGIAPKITTNRFGNPVIAFNQKRLVAAPAGENEITFAE